LRKKQIRFCYECAEMPCNQLAKLDDYYRAHYGMSMVENQKMIKEKGIDAFLKTQSEKYRCPGCGDIISVHDAKCYTCGYQADKPKGSNPKRRWVPNRKVSARRKKA
jgi:rubrerythrin